MLTPFDKLRSLYSHANPEFRLESEGFTIEHGGCFALLCENYPTAAELFIFNDGSILSLIPHIKSLAQQLLDKEVTEVYSYTMKSNSKSINILRLLTTDIRDNGKIYIAKGTTEDLKRAVEGQFLSVKNK